MNADNIKKPADRNVPLRKFSGNPRRRSPYRNQHTQHQDQVRRTLPEK